MKIDKRRGWPPSAPGTIGSAAYARKYGLSTHNVVAFCAYRRDELGRVEVAGRYFYDEEKLHHAYTNRRGRRIGKARPWRAQQEPL